MIQLPLDLLKSVNSFLDPYDKGAFNLTCTYLNQIALTNDDRFKVETINLSIKIRRETKKNRKLSQLLIAYEAVREERFWMRITPNCFKQCCYQETVVRGIIQPVISTRAKKLNDLQTKESQNRTILQLTKLS